MQPTRSTGLNRRLDQALFRLRNRAPAIGGPLALVAGITRLLTSRDSILRTSGWFASLRRGEPVGPDGAPVPWINYQMIELIEKRLPSDARVFEFGSGASTRWLAARAAEVVSLEVDEAWYHRVLKTAPANVVLLLHSGELARYATRPTAEGGNFDLVVIDGIDRSTCLEHVTGALSPAGVVLLDDSERADYRTALTSFLHEGFHELRLRGLKPLAVRGSISCSLLYRDHNCLGL